MQKRKLKIKWRPCCMGLDLSTRGTGVSIFDSKGNHLYTEVIAPKDSELTPLVYPRLIKNVRRIHHFQRYDFMVKRVLQLVKAYSVKYLVVENYAFGIRNSRAVTILAELGGIVRMCLLQEGVYILEITPQSLKKFVAGSGAAAKSDLPLRVFQKWNEDFPNIRSSLRLDAADSYGLGKIAFYYYSLDVDTSKLKQYEIDTLNKIRTSAKEEKKKKRKKKDAIRKTKKIKA